MFAVVDVTRNATRSSGAPGGDLQPIITRQPQFSLVSEYWVIEGTESSAETPVGLNQIYQIDPDNGLTRAFVLTTGLC